MLRRPGEWHRIVVEFVAGVLLSRSGGYQ
jgi:hypothetical protein